MASASLFGLKKEVIVEQNENKINVLAVTRNAWLVPVIIGRVDNSFDFQGLTNEGGLVARLAIVLNAPSGVGLLETMGILMPFAKVVEEQTLQLTNIACDSSFTANVETCTLFSCQAHEVPLCQN